MKRAWFLSISLFILYMGFAASQSEASKPIRMMTGVSYVHDNDPLSFQRVKATGSTFVHGWLRWNQVAPKSKPANWNPRDPFDPNYNWEYVDSWMTNATRAGLIPIGHIYYAPTWANRCVSPPQYKATNPPCNPSPTAMADFGYAAALRYSGKYPSFPKVTYWQPQNEPNLSLFFQPQKNSAGEPVSPGLYRDLLNSFYFAVKLANPHSIVISGGLAPNATPASLGPMEFARELFCMTGRVNPKPKEKCTVYLDGFDIHPYTSGGPTHKGKIDSLQLGDLWKITRLVAAADKYGIIQGQSFKTPIWATEIGWDSRPQDPGGVAPWILNRWTSEAVYRLWKAGINRVFWYQLRDQAPGNLPFSSSAQSGLYARGSSLQADKAKSNILAFRFPFVAFPKKSWGRIQIWGRVPSGKRQTVSIDYKKGNRWYLLARFRTNGFGVFERYIRVGKRFSYRTSIRARVPRVKSVPFSLIPVKDFNQPVFG